MKMRQMVAAGKLPGVTKQSQLFWDNNETKNRDDHAAHQTVVLAMLCACGHLPEIARGIEGVVSGRFLLGAHGRKGQGSRQRRPARDLAEARLGDGVEVSLRGHRKVE